MCVFMPYFQFISPSSSLLARRAEGGTHTQPPPPMHIDLPGIQNRPFRAQRAYTSPRRITLYPRRAPFWDPRGARRNLGVRFRLIRAVATRRNPVVYRSGILSGGTVLAPPGSPAARSRAKGATSTIVPTRDPRRPRCPVVRTVARDTPKRTRRSRAFHP